LSNNEKSYQRQNILNNEDSKRIPLLETLFIKYPDIPMNIDIKDNNDELINKVKKISNANSRQIQSLYYSVLRLDE
jgi:hypothetical protein